MRVAREEIFGPVAVIIKFHSEEEVIEMANDSQYGLGGGVFTQNINRAIRVARAVETGRMWVNTYNSIPAGAPFGGVKQSGIGRETHKVMLEHYTQMKSIIINLCYTIRHIKLSQSPVEKVNPLLIIFLYTTIYGSNSCQFFFA